MARGAWAVGRFGGFGGWKGLHINVVPKKRLLGVKGGRVVWEGFQGVLVRLLGKVFAGVGFF